MSETAHPRRRSFLKASVLAGVAVAAAPLRAQAQSNDMSGRSPAPAPSPQLKVAEAGAVKTDQRAEDPAALHEYVPDPGSDFMIDVLRAAGIRHVALIPGSTFRGFQESLINYAGERGPDMIVCVHEEISAAIAHGYAKVSGEMMACIVHSDVGLQHASMAIYDAWCDRAPMLVLAANILNPGQRRPGVEWTHTMQDVATIVRDFVKWDDTPVSLQHFAESTMRACQFARTGPSAPVLIIADADLQERNIEDRAALSIPARVDVVPPEGEAHAVDRLAAMLVDAERPLIVADRAVHTRKGMDDLIALAELIHAPVLDQAGRMNMPTTHYLFRSPHQTRIVADCDLMLGLELSDPWGTANSYADLTERTATRRLKASAKSALIGTANLFTKPNVQDLQRYFTADLTIAGEVEATLPALIAAVTARLVPDRRSAIDSRKALREQEHDAIRTAAVKQAAEGWNSSPITGARVAVELWDLIEKDPWALVSDPMILSGWPLLLWDLTEPYHHIGGSGGFGIGYGISAAVGAALGHKEKGRFGIAFQGDGDLMMLPGSLWTLAHHELPLLVVLQNNGAWHQEFMHVQRMTNRRNRGADRAGVGTQMTDPRIHYADMARSMGVYAEGPISDPAKLGPAMRRGLDVVRAGKPAFLDVVMEPR
jgi:acetolactate synthase-1/2/3 large subunit